MHWQIMKLKDKLGTQQLPSAEVLMHGYKVRMYHSETALIAIS